MAKPVIKRAYTILQDLAIMESNVTKLTLNKPIYVGFMVLEILRLWMYSFHYRHMINWFSDIRLTFTDTDSLLYYICGQDLYVIMKEHSNWFVFSNYPFEHPLYDPVNKKRLGMMKDELSSLCLEEI